MTMFHTFRPALELGGQRSAVKLLAKDGEQLVKLHRKVKHTHLMQLGTD
jgi:hypothetical protein